MRAVSTALYRYSMVVEISPALVAEICQPELGRNRYVEFGTTVGIEVSTTIFNGVVDLMPTASLSHSSAGILFFCQKPKVR
jgi:hypothetical protein